MCCVLRQFADCDMTGTDERSDECSEEGGQGQGSRECEDGSSAPQGRDQRCYQVRTRAGGCLGAIHVPGVSFVVQVVAILFCLALSFLQHWTEESM